MKTTQQMTKAEAVRRLDALDGGDPEADHGDADAILLEFVPPEVRRAWTRARERVGFWYA